MKKPIFVFMSVFLVAGVSFAVTVCGKLEFFESGGCLHPPCPTNGTILMKTDSGNRILPVVSNELLKQLIPLAKQSASVCLHGTGSDFAIQVERFEKRNSGEPPRDKKNDAPKSLK
jgi:hypothetical protein